MTVAILALLIGIEASVETQAVEIKEFKLIPNYGNGTGDVVLSLDSNVGLTKIQVYAGREDLGMANRLIAEWEFSNQRQWRGSFNLMPNNGNIVPWYTMTLWYSHISVDDDLSGNLTTRYDRLFQPIGLLSYSPPPPITPFTITKVDVNIVNNQKMVVKWATKGTPQDVDMYHIYVKINGNRAKYLGQVRGSDAKQYVWGKNSPYTAREFLDGPQFGNTYHFAVFIIKWPRSNNLGPFWSAGPVMFEQKATATPTITPIPTRKPPAVTPTPTITPTPFGRQDDVIPEPPSQPKWDSQAQNSGYLKYDCESAYQVHYNVEVWDGDETSGKWVKLLRNFVYTEEIAPNKYSYLVPFNTSVAEPNGITQNHIYRLIAVANNGKLWSPHVYSAPFMVPTKNYNIILEPENGMPKKGIWLNLYTRLGDLHYVAIWVREYDGFTGKFTEFPIGQQISKDMNFYFDADDYNLKQNHHYFFSIQGVKYMPNGAELQHVASLQFTYGAQFNDLYVTRLPNSGGAVIIILDVDALNTYTAGQSLIASYQSNNTLSNNIFFNTFKPRFDKFRTLLSVPALQ